MAILGKGAGICGANLTYVHRYTLPQISIGVGITIIIFIITYMVFFPILSFYVRQVFQKH